MQDGITMLIAPLPGVRLGENKELDQDGSILGFRKNGDEVLFTSWDVEDRGGMQWIPVTEFAPEPDSVMPPEVLAEQQTEEVVEEGAAEKPSSSGPFGRGGLRRRPELES